MTSIVRAIASTLAAIGTVLAAFAFTIFALAAVSAIWWIPIVIALVTWKVLFG